MCPFDEYLEDIGNQITIKDEDREVYTKDFDRIRDHVLNMMCEQDPVFKRLYKGPSLFGSYCNNVRINKPNEFDVIFKLTVPFSDDVLVTPDDDRPGFVFLDFEKVMNKLEIEYKNEYGSAGNRWYAIYDRFYDLVDWKNDYMRRTNLQNWLHKLIMGGLMGYNGNRVYGIWSRNWYTLKYSKRGLAHTIYAECENRCISIDFVPAFVFGPVRWMDIRPSHPFYGLCDDWFALPKPTWGPKSTRRYTFMICNPIAENHLLLRKQNLKVVFRLLKSLRNRYEMPRLKSYFLTTAFLWEIEEQEEYFWHYSISFIFVHMLDVLSGYFIDGDLPFFWNRDYNLLKILSADEIEDYKSKLIEAYNTLSTYRHQKLLTFNRCASHFALLD